MTKDAAAVIIHESNGVQTAGPLPPYNPQVTSAKCNPENASLVRALRNVGDLDHMQICQAAADEIERLGKLVSNKKTTYHGPHGETVTANDDAGLEFLQAYARYAAGDERQQREAMKMLAAVVHSAGGIVRVPNRGLYMFGTKLRIEIRTDMATMDLVLKTTTDEKA